MINGRVLIVGAGPTGLVLALWLTRLGVSVRIIDKTAEPGTTSRAVGVQARTLEFYRQAGISEAVVEGSVKVEGVNLWVRGARAARVPFHRMGEGLSPFPFSVYVRAGRPREIADRAAGGLGGEGGAPDGVGPIRSAPRRRARRAQTTRRLRGDMRSGLSRRLRRSPFHRAKGWRPVFPAAPTAGSSTSPTWRRPGRPPTAKSMSNSKRPISWGSFH